jgi:hypothetical protein
VRSPVELGRLVQRRALAAVRRRTRSPFAASAGPATLVHCSHHKVGTVWFHSVLGEVSAAYGLRTTVVRRRPVRIDGADVAFFEQSRFFDRAHVDGSPWRGSHLIRDPRDMVVSGYHYHLRTTEEWALTPAEQWGGMSYQEHLRALSPHDGLLAEIRRGTGHEIHDISVWDYEQPEFLELRYEDVIADEAQWFERLFRHFGFDADAIALGLAAAERLSLRTVAKRRQSGDWRAGHVRSGQPGDWRAHFTDEHTALFKECTGDLLVRLGYEQTTSW